MSYEFKESVPQGWQCPICGDVYSPFTPMCYNCTGKTKTTTSITTTGNSPIDWLHHDSTTVSNTMELKNKGEKK